MSVEDLMSLEGVDEELARKLIKKGVLTVTVLASIPVKDLVHADYGVGIDYTTAKKLIKAAQERCDSLFGFEMGEELIQQYENRQYLSTGTRALDVILHHGRGFKTQTVYEIYGPEGGGKSDLLHQLICTAYLPPDRGGLGTGSIYIDTEGMFSLKKIEQIAQRFGINYEDLKRNILKASPPNSEVLLHFCATQLERLAHERGARFFCLDNLATHFQAEYEGVGETLPERQQKINGVIHALKRAVQQTNGVAIYTNQITKNGKPALGYITKHEAQVRILVDVKDLSKGLRVFRVVKALEIPPRETILKLSSKGFIDHQRGR